MKVLVPLDGSVLAECMLEPATRLAKGGELDLVRVLSVEASHDKKARGGAEQYLEAQRKRLEAEDLNVRWNLEAGDPAEQILVVVEEHKPDWISMATHGQTGHVRRVRGSVAERVLRESRTPVLMANPRGIPHTHDGLFGKILVALDGSDLAERILDHVESLAMLYGSQVVLLRVEPAHRFSQRAFDPEQVTASMAAQQSRLEAKGIKVKCWAMQGDPAEEILRAADGVDLVCMSTHGRSGISRWWFGSVAEQVLRVCDRPLLIVRPGAE